MARRRCQITGLPEDDCGCGACIELTEDEDSDGGEDGEAALMDSRGPLLGWNIEISTDDGPWEFAGFVPAPGLDDTLAMVADLVVMEIENSQPGSSQVLPRLPPGHRCPAAG